jgi:glutaredoxin
MDAAAVTSTARPAGRVCFSPAGAPLFDVKPKRVRLFIKPYCGWCHKAMRWLNEHQADYTAIDVTTDEMAMAEMVRLSGGEIVPVIEVDGRVLADFGPEQLAEFWERLEQANGRN